MKKVKDYDCENIAISIYHRLNSLYGLGMMLEEEKNSIDEFDRMMEERRGRK